MMSEDDISRLRRIVEDMQTRLALMTSTLYELEWSGEREGQGSYMGATDGPIYAACPECGGLPPLDWDPSGSVNPDAAEEFAEEAFGHRSGCKIALCLNRPTTIPEGQNGELTL